jgi:hypothetical protein
VTSIDIDELDDEHEKRHDFRRANGAPLVSSPTEPGKTERYSRPSGFHKPLDDEFALTNWRIFKAMDGVARSKALQTQIVACKDDDRVEKARLREVALDKGEANERADQGTGLHAMTVRAEDVKDVDFDPGEHAEDLAEYMKLLDTYGLVSEMTEVPLVNDDYRAAGTADRIFRLTWPLVAPNGDRLEPGTLIVGDLKTGAKLDFNVPGFCVQTALYATGVLYDVIAERRLPTPPINKQWTLLIHLPVGRHRAELYWCSVEVGLYGAWLAFEVKKWQARWKKGEYDIKLVEAPDTSLPETTIQKLATEGIEATVVASDEIMPEMIEYCRQRMATIATHDGAKAWVIRNWPEGLPSPKKGGHTPQQMVTLLDLLDEAEKKFSIPWTAQDPRVALQQGVHKSAMDRSNQLALIKDAKENT